MDEMVEADVSRVDGDAAMPFEARDVAAEKPPVAYAFDGWGMVPLALQAD